MRRGSGWGAGSGGLGGGADWVLLPELPGPRAGAVEHLHRRRREGRFFSIIVVAEGIKMAELQGSDAADHKTDAFGHVQLSRIGVGDSLSRHIEGVTGFETRVTVLGHLQRGGTPSSVDRIWATRLGAAATDLLAEGKSGLIPVRRNGDVVVIPLKDVVAEQRRVPAELYELAKVFG